MLKHFSLYVEEGENNKSEDIYISINEEAGMGWWWSSYLLRDTTLFLAIRRMLPMYIALREANFNPDDIKDDDYSYIARQIVGVQEDWPDIGEYVWKKMKEDSEFRKDMFYDLLYGVLGDNVAIHFGEGYIESETENYVYDVKENESPFVLEWTEWRDGKTYDLIYYSVELERMIGENFRSSKEVLDLYIEDFAEIEWERLSKNSEPPWKTFYDLFEYVEEFGESYDYIADNGLFYEYAIERFELDKKDELPETIKSIIRDRLAENSNYYSFGQYIKFLTGKNLRDIPRVEVVLDLDPENEKHKEIIEENDIKESRGHVFYTLWEFDEVIEDPNIEKTNHLIFEPPTENFSSVGVIFSIESGWMYMDNSIDSRYVYTIRMQIIDPYKVCEMDDVTIKGLFKKLLDDFSGHYYWSLPEDPEIKFLNYEEENSQEESDVQ